MEELLDGVFLVIEHQGGHVIVVIVVASRLVRIMEVDTSGGAEILQSGVGEVWNLVARQQRNTCAQECGEQEHEECGDNSNQDSFHDSGEVEEERDNILSYSV